MSSDAIAGCLLEFVSLSLNIGFNGTTQFGSIGGYLLKNERDVFDQ
jgi:hypothetical protein